MKSIYLPMCMSLCKAFFVLLLALTALWSNLRAPLRIERARTALKSAKAELRILGEDLAFSCPPAYTGKADMQILGSRTCAAHIRYRIAADKKESVRLEFLFSGAPQVRWQHNGKRFAGEAATLNLTDKKTCSFCPDSMKKIQSAEQTIEFDKGESELEISYLQALSYDERGHGYFSDGQWTQSFSYELWPIAEWPWEGNIHARLRFSIAARPGFLGIGFKDDRMECRIEENGVLTPLALAVAKPENERRTATAGITLARRPQRLVCSYAAD